MDEGSLPTTKGGSGIVGNIAFGLPA